MRKTAKILFLCAIIWEIASILWFMNPYRFDFSPVGWFCIVCGILCAIGGVIANRRG